MMSKSCRRHSSRRHRKRNVHDLSVFSKSPHPSSQLLIVSDGDATESSEEEREANPQRGDGPTAPDLQLDWISSDEEGEGREARLDWQADPPPFCEVVTLADEEEARDRPESVIDLTREEETFPLPVNGGAEEVWPRSEEVGAEMRGLFLDEVIND